MPPRLLSSSSSTTTATTTTLHDLIIYQKVKTYFISICIIFSIFVILYHIFIPKRLNLIPELGAISINNHIWQNRGNHSIIGGMGYNITSLPQREKKYLSNIFPRIVHQMWKDTSIPSELNRWKEGCKALSSEYEFRMYHDDTIKIFVAQNYPEYEPLFKSLKGVYMADMARFLLTYHYGGLYMDLDFYCHRPIHCLELSLPNDVLTSTNKNILAVSLEPLIHANLLRNKTRVVIQDFMLATPKHPFLKWMLDDRKAVYEKQVAENSIFTKGPFSYAIENDIDRYKQITNTYKSKTNSSVIIYEFREEVLHSLVDSTNWKLKKSCSNPETVSKYPQSCESIDKKLYFRPSDNTIGVHMWSHVHVGWYFIRFAYSANIYDKVERTLPPTFRCPPSAEKRAKERTEPKPVPIPKKERSKKDNPKDKKVPQQKVPQQQKQQQQQLQQQQQQHQKVPPRKPNPNPSN